MPVNNENTSNELPSHARVVVIGGGVIGTSVAYNLAEMGCSDVVLLERDSLTSGTTWHAAGLLQTFGSMSETSTEVRISSLELYKRLEAETGQATGLNQCGVIEIATDPGSLEEYRRVAAINRYHGVGVEEISAKEVLDLFPAARVDDILTGFYIKEDGRINPVDVTMALAKGAKMKGVKIITDLSATDVASANGVVNGVITDRGTIGCEFVVNCAGMWARQFGEKHGILIPNQAVEHYYLITEKVDGIDASWPVLEDPSHHGYYREEGGGLMVGMFEPEAAAWMVDGIPQDFSFGEIQPNWDRMAPFLEKSMSRVPISLESGVKSFFCGPESFTPDRNPIVGEVGPLKNYFVCAGLNSIGITTGGGLGRILAHWILNGLPDVDITEFNANRFQTYQSNPQYRAARGQEGLENAYKCHYPTKVAKSGRMAKRSALHDRLADAGACFTDVSGWEGPGWFATKDGSKEVGELSWGRMHWWKNWEEEHRACREAVALFDMSFMANFLVQGNDAGTALDFISANNVNGSVGRITYTQWLNEQGTLEADVTVIKIEDDKFMVVVSDTMHVHALNWLRRNIAQTAHAFVTDVTSGLTQINVQGPKSRVLLQELTTADLSNAAFPFRTARNIDIGIARALCVRITYVGELGYELYVPCEQAVQVYDQLLKAGKKHGLRHAGLRALGSLRMEKAYRDYGHDLDNTDNAFETGLGFAVRLGKPDGFIGQKMAMKQNGATSHRKRLVQVLVNDPEPMLWHGEIVFHNDQPVGVVRSGSYGHTLGGAVGLAMIDGHDAGVSAKSISSGKWEIEIAGQRYQCTCSLSPLYDPKMVRIRA